MKAKSIIAIILSLIIFTAKAKADNQPLLITKSFSEEIKKQLQGHFNDVCTCSGSFSLNGYTLYIAIAYISPVGFDCSQPTWYSRHSRSVYCRMGSYKQWA